MRRKLRAWLVPTFVAPAAVSVLIVALLTLAGASGFFGVARGLALALIAGLAGLSLSLALLAVDWLLLLFRRRVPPTGRRAWISSALAPLPTYGLWLVFRPPLLSAPSTHALAVAAALIGGALAVRLLTRPPSGRSFRFS